MSDQTSLENAKHDYLLHSNQGSIAPKQSFLQKYAGPLTLLGGVCIHLVLGTFYLWGAISIYVASYLRNYDTSVTISLLLSLSPLTGMGMNFGLFFGVPLAEKFGPKVILASGICIISLSVFLTSYAESFFMLSALYGFVNGFFNGVLYMIPVVCGWKFYPNNKGLVSGITIGAFGFGSFIFNFIATGVVNPNNLKPTIIDGDEKYFGPEVADRVPQLFRTLGICYLALGLVGALLIRSPKAQSENSERLPENETNGQIVSDEPTVSVKEGVFSKPFILLFIMASCGATLGLFLVSIFKVYGGENINDDHFLTLVGSFGSVGNGCTRAVWALFFDKYGFKKVYFTLLTIQAILAPTLSLVSSNKALYLIWYCLIMSCEGGHFAMFPSVTAKVFGLKNGPKIYGYLFWSFAVASWIGLLASNLAINHTGWNAMFLACFGLTLVSFVCNIFFKEKYTKKE